MPCFRRCIIHNRVCASGISGLSRWMNGRRNCMTRYGADVEQIVKTGRLQPIESFQYISFGEI